MKIQAGCCRSRVMLRSLGGGREGGGVPDGRGAKLNFSRKEAESPHRRWGEKEISNFSMISESADETGP
jgi:hypothetical protein